MSQHAGFLQEIVAHPDDPVPRLIYADWLEELGDPRGEFIRAQCELAGACKPARRKALRAREQALLAEHRHEWLAPLGHLRDPEFRRGFVERATMSVSTFIKSGAEILERTPLRYATLTSGGNRFAALVACPFLSRLSGLDFQQNRSRLSSGLDFQQNSMGDSNLELLASCPHFQQLAELRIRANSISYRGIEALARSPYFGGLRSLWMTNNAIGDDGADRLAGSEHLAGLRKLVLEGCDLGGAAAAAIGRSQHLQQLEALDLSGNHNVGPDGAQSLAGATNLASLKFLSLSGCLVGPAGARALGEAPHLLQLQTLVLNHCRIGDSGARALAQSPLLARLADLRISGNELTVAGVEALLASPRWNAKTKLYLANNLLGQADVHRLETRFGRSLGL